MYKTAIRPVVTYAPETMCLASSDEGKLERFGRKKMRRISGFLMDNTHDG